MQGIQHETKKVIILNIIRNLKFNSLLINRCLCWSPKGKQLVTGNNDGTLTQYKPDLSQMKMVATPNLFEGAPVEVLSIYWIATYQFAVAYRNASDNSRPGEPSRSFILYMVYFIYV